MKAGFVFLPIGVGLTLLHAVGILAMLLTGSWSYNIPDAFQTINPLFMWIDGVSNPIVPETAFSSFTSSNKLFTCTNVFLFGTIQWIGLGLILDLVRSKL